MKNFKKIIVVMIVAAIAVLFVACDSTNTKVEVEDDKISVAVSIPPQKGFIEAICGDLVNVVTMIPPGNSPTNYEPTPQEIADFADAKIYFSIGVATERENILPSVSDKTEVVDLAAIVNDVYPDLTMNGGRDPHTWLSPKRAVVMIDTMADKIAEIDPDNAQTYQTNAENYIAQIESVDSKLKGQIENLSSNKFIVFHPAFGYLADDYGLEQYPLEIDGKEATPENLQNMIDLAKEENIKVIFHQGEIDSNQTRAFAEEIGGKTVKLYPLSEDYIENLKSMLEAISEEMK